MEYSYNFEKMPEVVHRSQNSSTDRITRKFIVGQQGMACVFRWKDPMVFPMHKHPHEQFSIVQQGRFRYRVGDVEREVGPGDIVMIPGNVMHGYDVLEPDSINLEFYTPVREDFIKTI